MRTLSKLAFLILVITLLSSCAGTKKINFETAYKFSTYNYDKVVKEDNTEERIKQPNNRLYASNKAILEEDPQHRLAKVEEKLYRKIGVGIEEGRSMKTGHLAKEFKKLDRKDKREMRREIKAELKHLKNLDAKNSYSVNDTDHINSLTPYTRLAIIIGSVGLILLVLGAVFSAGFLSFVGAVAIVGAAILFIIDYA